MTNPYSFGLSLKHDYADFVSYKGKVLPDEIEKIRGCWDGKKSTNATVSGNMVAYRNLRKSSVMWLDNNPENKWIYDRMALVSIHTNNQRYRFDLLGFHERLQLTMYGEGDFFDWHSDFGAGEISSRKLSLTVQLSDPDEYEGGTLQFMINQDIVDAPRDKGTIIVFPSFVQHRVTPITKGARQCIVGWVTGPPYR